MLSQRARAAIDRTAAARAELDALLGDRADLPTLGEMEYAYVIRVLAMVGGNASEAARIVGVHRSRLRRIIARAGSSYRSRGRHAQAAAASGS